MVTPALVWPGLDLEAMEAGRHLRRRLAHAARRHIPARDSLALAAVALGIEAPPAGALARLADGFPAEDRAWFLAAPVSLVPDRDRLLLLPLDTSEELTGKEADALADAARKHFGSALALERGASGRWYAALADVGAAASEPLDAVAGTQVDISDMAQGEDAAALRRFLNELQMLWYAHPVNVARRETGRAQANALWLWGGGRLPEQPEPKERMPIQASAPEMAGLADWCGLEHVPLEAPGAESDGRLVVIGAGEEAIGQAWLRAWATQTPAFRVYTAGVERRVPARSGLPALFGW